MNLPPNTTQLSATISPSEYGPTTVLLSTPVSSFILILSGGTERKTHKLLTILILLRLLLSNQYESHKSHGYLRITVKFTLLFLV